MNASNNSKVIHECAHSKNMRISDVILIFYDFSEIYLWIKLFFFARHGAIYVIM